MPDAKKTIKQIAITKSDERLLDDLANGSDFWSSIRAKYAEYGTLTERQRDLLVEEREKQAWRKDALRIGGVAIRNKFTTQGGRPRCAHRGKPWCEDAATIVVGAFGFCHDHAGEAEDELKDWLDARKAERAQEKSAELEAEDGD
jgi:hypothetical protein